MSHIPQSDLRLPVERFMLPVETAVRSDQTVGAAVAELRSRSLTQRIFYLYAVDRDGRLAGVIPTRAFLFADPAQPIETVMAHPVISIRSDTTLEAAMEEFAMHRLLALPVVDAEGRLLGAVDVRLYAEEMHDLAESQRAFDLFQLIGLSAELARHRSAWTGFRLRMPWLAFNLVGGLLCAMIAWLFGAALERVLLLSLFIPLVLTLSEAVSMQSMTLGLQLLHGEGVSWPRIRERLSTELRTTVILGATCGLLVGGAALLWGQGFAAPSVIALSILIAMACAAAIGVVLPAVIHRMRLDPKLASGPLVLMTGDIVTMTVYLGLAIWWLV